MLVDNIFERLNPSKGTQFVLYILSHTNPETQIFDRTYKQIQEDTGISQVSISEMLKKLEARGTIVRAGIGAWRIPAVIGSSKSYKGPGLFVTHQT